MAEIKQLPVHIPPMARILTYNGEPQQLVSGGDTEWYGEIQYSLSAEDITADSYMIKVNVDSADYNYSDEIHVKLTFFG